MKTQQEQNKGKVVLKKIRTIWQKPNFLDPFIKKHLTTNN